MLLSHFSTGSGKGELTLSEPAGSSYERGVIFGYEVRSPLSFSYLRPGQADQTLTVEPSRDLAPAPESDPVLEWTPRPGRPFRARLHREEDRFLLWTSDAGWFDIDTATSKITVPATFDLGDHETRLWSVPTALCFMTRGDLAIHASAVQVGESALLFGAPGHFGKTTLAAGFLGAGHSVLTEDLSCVQPSVRPMLFPGAAALRVRPDTYANLQFPWTRVISEQDDRVHLAIDEGRRGDGSAVSVAGVILIRPGAEQCRLHRVDPTVALRDIWSLTLKLPNADHRALTFESLATIISSLPVWDLSHPRDYGLLPTVIDEVVSTCLAA